MKIYNLGSLNIDYVYSVDHFVAAGETVSSTERKVYPGGKGLNQSVAVARAGGDVVHGALIGEGAEFLVETMKSSGVDVSKTVKTTFSPGHAIIQVNRHGNNCIMIYPGANRELTAEYVEDFLSGAGEGDILLAQNETNCVDKAFEIAKSKNMKIAFNPSPCDDGILTLPLELVDYWFCNETEAKRLFGSDDPKTVCGAFQNSPFNSSLILTLGEEGSYFVDKTRIISQKAYKTKAVDTTAAGDTFTGYFLASVCHGEPVEAAMDIASRASAITVSRSGASSSIPYLREVVK